MLPSRACLEVHGADAAAFLDGQLAVSIASLEPDRAPLAAWLDARGRVRALLRVVRLPDRWLLATEAAAVESIVRKLRMFVLRAAVTIAPAEDVGVAALVDADDAWLAAHGLPQSGPADALAAAGELRMVAVGPGLQLVIGKQAAIDAWTPALPRAPGELAALAEIRLGIPAVPAAIAERYVAQMLNLDRLGAVAFDKGCYPGQEVVARVQHLGSVKRRLRRFAIDAPPPAVGAEVLASDRQAVGEVVRAAAVPDAGSELLAVIERSALADAITVDGSALRPLPLPYALPEP